MISSPEAAAQPQPVNNWQLAQYSLLALPIAIIGLPVYLHSPDFYANQLGVSLGAIGFVLLGLRLIDAIQDPLIGALCDKFHHRKELIIITGSALACAGLWMLFHPYKSSPLLWLAASVFLCTTGFSILTIKIQALGSLWKTPKDNLSKIMTSREGVGLIGLLIGAALPTVLTNQFSAPLAFHYFTLIILPIMIISALVFMYWLKRISFFAPSQAITTEKNIYQIVFDTAYSRRFFLCFLISAFASSIPATLIIFYVRDYLQAEPLLGAFLAVYFISGAAAMPLWRKLSQLYSAAFAWWLSMLLAVITFSWAFFLASEATGGFFIVCLMSGISVGANLALPPTIAAEMINQQSHQNSASRYYALMAFISKSALALATGIALPLLSMTGYQPGTVNTGMALPAMYALLPCGFQLLALATAWPLAQKPSKHQEASI